MVSWTEVEAIGPFYVRDNLEKRVVAGPFATIEEACAHRDSLGHDALRLAAADSALDERELREYHGFERGEIGDTRHG